MLKITMSQEGERTVTIESPEAPELCSWLHLFSDALSALGYAKYELDVVGVQRPGVEEVDDEVPRPEGLR